MRYRAIYLGREKVMGFSADVPLSAFARAVLPSGRFVRSYASAWTGGAAMAWAFWFAEYSEALGWWQSRARRLGSCVFRGAWRALAGVC